MKQPYRNLALTAAVFAALAACKPQEGAPAASQPAPDKASAAVAAKPAAGFHGTDMSKEDIGGDFTLTGGDGKPFRLSDLKGKAVLLTFGYTNCPDVCPTELLNANDALKQLGKQAEDVAVVFVSVDPERDTPEVVGKYAKQFNPSFIGVTAVEGQDLPLVKQQFRVVSSKVNVKDGNPNYLVDHTAGAYLVDKKGEVAVFEPYGSPAAQVAEDLKALLNS